MIICMGFHDDMEGKTRMGHQSARSTGGLSPCCNSTIVSRAAPHPFACHRHIHNHVTYELASTQLLQTMGC